ncbi:MAG: gamma-glutamyltransferase, partial [Pusillimonas sp.]
MNETRFGSGAISSFCASGGIRSGPTYRAGWAGCILAVVLAALPISSRADPPPDPEAAVSTTRHPLAEATQFMVSAANPLATRVGVGILEKGGNAVDAAIAVQLILGLVEPQSSGIGGGGFMLVYDQAEQRLTSFDARETAPMAAHYRQFIHQGKALSWPEAVNSGLSVGVPGLLRG